MSSIIQFINRFPNAQLFFPEPAIKNIPKWYKDSESYMGNNSREDEIELKEKGINTKTTNATIKKCMPVFDSMTSGYIIKLPASVEVYKVKENVNNKQDVMAFSWTLQAPIKQHAVEQAALYPHNKIHKVSIPKFINPWIIRTSPGYSCLFLPPMHREAKFNILPGIVDTDTFTHAVNFPFTLTDPDFEGEIEAGTPIAQVIPFKRDEFSYEVYYDGEEYVSKYPDTDLFLNEFPDSYKKDYWHKKEYK